MEKILIIKLSALGDIVQAEGAIHDIRENHRNALISVLTTPPYRKIMARCPWIDQVITDPRASWFNFSRMYDVYQKLRSGSFDMVFDLQQVDRTRMYRRLFLPAVPWMGDSEGCTYYLKRPKIRCAADHFALHLAIAGITVKHTLQSDVSWMIDNVDSILQTYRVPEKFIALLPGGSAEHPQKRWPLYQELAEKIIASGSTPVTIPGPDETELCATIPGITLLSGNSYLDYFQLAGVLIKASFIVGNDSGPTHIGAHLGKKGLALFGGHIPAESTGIQHTAFDWLEAENLQELPLDRVLQRLKPLLSPQ